MTESPQAPQRQASDPKGMPMWGAAAAIGALGVAALVALQGETPPSQPKATAPVASPLSPTVNQPGGAPGSDPSTPNGQSERSIEKSAASPKVAVDTASAGDDDAANPNLEFIVRFRSGPLAEAQAMFTAGDQGGAEAAARKAIEARTNLRGLCFSRFTLGGAEMVLSHCARVPDTQKKAVSQRWDRRLNAMPDVDYADPNFEVRNDNPVRPPR